MYFINNWYYPSAKEYIIEVFNESGNRIWGGFDENGTVLHDQILRSAGNSVTYNFDNSATENLRVGGVYQWKIYVDNDDAPNVQGLITSSEDLMGTFLIVEDSI